MTPLPPLLLLQNPSPSGNTSKNHAKHRQMTQKTGTKKKIPSFPKRTFSHLFSFFDKCAIFPPPYPTSKSRMTCKGRIRRKKERTSPAATGEVAYRRPRTVAPWRGIPCPINGKTAPAIPPSFLDGDPQPKRPSV